MFAHQENHFLKMGKKLTSNHHFLKYARGAALVNESQIKAR